MLCRAGDVASRVTFTAETAAVVMTHNYLDDVELLRILRAAWLGRADRYSEQREELRRESPEPKKIEMYYIGG